MNPCTYRDGILHIEDVPLPRIAEAVGTPVYCYAASTVGAAYDAVAGAFGDQAAMICYAVKANSNLAILHLLGRRGAGADIVSIGEMRRALAAGIPADRIVFSGVGKTRDELREAVAAGIHQINVESVPELHALSDVATELGVSAPIGLRVNPDVDALTLKQITTGTRDNKFGIDIERAPGIYRLARDLPGIAAVGVAAHIGSQVSELKPFRDTFERIAELVRSLRADGVPITRIDLGGGLAIVYHEEAPTDLKGYAALVRDVIGPLGCEIVVSPGRFLVGPAGVLLTSVVYRKTDLGRDFLIIDGAMNDLIRPALYGAWHGILPVREPGPEAVPGVYDVVGPVCESTDMFAERRALPPMDAGELAVITEAGAYCAVMSSQYNTRPLIPEVLVHGDTFSLVRKRPSFEEMVALEAIPPWLAHDA